LERVKVFLIPGLDWEIYLGTMTFILALLLIAITIIARLPYHIWFLTHRFMVIALVLAFLHAVLSGSDVRAHPIMMGVLSVLFSAGLMADLYMLFIYRPLNSRRTRVRSSSLFSNILELKLERPLGFRFEPGQFIFVRFPRINRCEFFPFSISSDRYEDFIRVSIKATGDTTSALKDRIRRGDDLRILGPYGRFGERYLSHDKDMVWIAGGIGITPFLSMSMNESVHPTGRRVHLFYVMRNLEDAHYDHELATEMKRNRSFRYEHWITSEKGRISAQGIERELGGVRNRLIFLCGPPMMMKDISKQFIELGVPAKNIIYEDFDLLGH
jgi:predicted ferric reductase